MIIQTILLDPTGAVWTDDAGNVSRLDPSGAIQTDAEHPTRNRKVDDRSAVTVISGLLVTLVVAVPAMAIYRWRRPGVRCETPRP
jgi:hypothetical protein